MSAIEKLRQYLVLSEEACFHAVMAELRGHGYSVYTDGSNYILGVPDSKRVLPVLVNAHIDTVRRDEDDRSVIITEGEGFIKNKVAAPLGGDDRCGVAMALAMAEQLMVKPYILLTTGEEIGCVGCRVFLKTELLGKIVNDIYLYVGLDRRGSTDAVMYSTKTFPAELRELVRAHGYVPMVGTSYSDVLHLSEVEPRIAHVNLSVGYHNPHRSTEYVNVKQFNSAYESAVNLINSVKRRYSAPPKYVPSYGSWYRDYRDHTPINPFFGPPAPTGIPRPWEHGGRGTAVLPSEDDRPVRCVLCQKDTRVSKFFPGISSHLCYVCAKKVLRFGGINLSSLQMANEELIKEQNMTRRANKVLAMRKTERGMIPKCPVCDSNKHSRFDSRERGFVCTKCMEIYGTETSDYSGVYWLEGSVRTFVRGETVYRAHLTHNKILYTGPLKADSFVKMCANCHKLTITPFVHTDGTALCPECHEFSKSYSLSSGVAW